MKHTDLAYLKKREIKITFRARKFFGSFEKGPHQVQAQAR